MTDDDLERDGDGSEGPGDDEEHSGDGEGLGEDEEAKRPEVGADGGAFGEDEEAKRPETGADGGEGFGEDEAKRPEAGADGGAFGEDEEAKRPEAGADGGDGFGEDETKAGVGADEEWEFEPLGVDEELLGSRESFPDAQDDDFFDDEGDWSVEDYLSSAKSFFGGGEHFGESAERRYSEAGYSRFVDQGLLGSLSQLLPDATSTFGLFQRGDSVAPIALGLITTAGLALLRETFPSLDLSRLHVTLPPREGESRRPPEPLPTALQSVNPSDTVDLRKLCPPVGDQGQTSRCAAFAWTHALELSANLLGKPAPRLACSYTMLLFQRRQGDEKGHRWAYQGGDGTGAEAEPGPTLSEHGTCREELWPDDAETPTGSDEELARDALEHRLQGSVSPVGIEDIKKVLTAGCPVVLAMNTGPAFSEVGRDGIVAAAEKPSGRHGRHAMLIVGYLGNYYVVRNSWGSDWGDNGYCYIPKNVLSAADPELEVVLLRRTAAPGGASGGEGHASRGRAAAGQPDVGEAPAGASSSASPWANLPDHDPAVQPMLGRELSQLGAQTLQPLPKPSVGSTTRCAACGAAALGGKFCAACGKPLAQPDVCAGCGRPLPASAKFCSSCGRRA